MLVDIFEEFEQHSCFWTLSMIIKNVAGIVSDSPKMQYFWRIRHALDDFFEEFEQ